MAKHDVVVVGGGHNGLTVAAYLAKAGVDVCIVEKLDKVGGGVVTREVTVPGFKHDTASIYHQLIQANPLIHRDELGLVAKYGLKYLYPDPQMTIIFPDDRALSIYRDVNKTVQSISQFSRKDAEVYPRFLEYMSQAARVAAVATFSPPIPFGRMVALLDGSEAGQEYLRIIFSSASDIIEEWFESEYTKTAITRVISESMIAPGEKGTGVGIFVFGLFHSRPSALPVGGSGALSDALLALINDKGGTIRVSSTVKSIKVVSGEAKAVVLESGEEIEAKRAIVSNLSVKQLFLQMLQPEGLPESFLNRIRRLKHSTFVPILQALALNEAPNYKAGGGANEGVLVELSPVGDEYLTMFENYAHGIPNTKAPMVGTATRLDPSRAPAGKHTLYVYHYEPYNLKDGGPQKWDDIKQQVADGILEAIRQRTTNMGPSNILGRWISSPLDFERYNPAWETGDFLHIGMFVTQMFANRPIPGWANYRTPVKKLYMCGASTHPGGGVNAGGRAAVQAIMEDLGIDFKKVIGR